MTTVLLQATTVMVLCAVFSLQIMEVAMIAIIAVVAVMRGPNAIEKCIAAKCARRLLDTLDIIDSL